MRLQQNKNQYLHVVPPLYASTSSVTKAAAASPRVSAAPRHPVPSPRNVHQSQTQRRRLNFPNSSNKQQHKASKTSWSYVTLGLACSIATVSLTAHISSWWVLNHSGQHDNNNVFLDSLSHSKSSRSRDQHLLSTASSRKLSSPKLKLQRHTAADPLSVPRWIRSRQERISTCKEGLNNAIDEHLDDALIHWTNRDKPLPEFKPQGNKGGGVIIFWHLAKTGGTTLRKQCATLPGVDYMMLVRPEDYHEGAKCISDRLTPPLTPVDPTPDEFNHSRDHTMFVEMHGIVNAPTVLDMEAHLREWRRLSQEHGTPLFVFTILREPMAYSLSYFNFFHQKITHQPTQKELQRTSFNRQCNALAAHPGQTETTCAQLYGKFYEWFDWVGTTERISQETLPLLQHLLRHKDAQNRFMSPEEPTEAELWLLPSNTNKTHYNVAERQQFSFHLESLSQETIEVIHDNTCLDQGLWERAQQDFTLDMWKDQAEIMLGGGPSSSSEQ